MVASICLWTHTPRRKHHLTGPSEETPRRLWRAAVRQLVPPLKARRSVRRAALYVGRATVCVIRRTPGVAQGWQPNIIYTSPLKRSIATAAAISQACGAEVGVRDELRNIDYGSCRPSTKSRRPSSRAISRW